MDIALFRRDTLRVSQRVFADLMNVSVQAVHAWEQGVKKPSGMAQRLLSIASAQPKVLLALIAEEGGGVKNEN